MTEKVKKTKKVIDYVLKKYVLQYINACTVRTEYDFDTDHRLLVTTLRTPKTPKN